MGETGEDARAEEGFSLGRPALVCRWRLAAGTLPLENRHLRALLQRTVNGAPVTHNLAGWAKQHIEWSLTDGAFHNPDGVLMIIVDEGGQAVMSVGPFVPLEDTSLAALRERAEGAAREGEELGIRPETLWAARDGALFCGTAADAHLSGATSLVRDLAATFKVPVTFEEGLLEELASGSAAVEEVFLVSDEFGVVSASDAAGPLGERLAQGYDRLLAAAQPQKKKH
jgi:hypothetical protein